MELICVYGAVNDKIDDSFKYAGKKKKKKIAEKNYGLIYSGMKGGFSGAVAKGVADTSNMPIIGVIPEFFKVIKTNKIFEGCTKRIFT